jgi:hypothetical protein
MNWKILAGILLVAGLGAGFFGGMKYQQSQAGSTTQAGRLRGTFGSRTGGNTNFQSVRGSIVNIDNNTLSVKLSDGSSKVVVLTDKTVYNKTSNGTKSDVSAGSNVMVIGTSNSDGSITAQNVQLNPEFFNRGNGPTGQPSGQPNSQ